ncbi:MAG: 3-dehydroquinate synthase [Rhodobiaceae bacterium]|nr:3-dehydroquinate synthase [Rhodobiaceae bacterium]MCC0013768.1 3-dehydroquinate synthase [Rhodobiaceae bacterium]MCC0018604.1 3-dehydroquinate synthase [Rhodobiaceae bacterium]MCC0062198.1 3-dehydroquinate synthase [Rhodobiaceae bacterium]
MDKPTAETADLRTVHVELGARSYDIFIGHDLISTAGSRIAAIAPCARAAVIADETVFALHGSRLVASLDAAGIGHVTITVPPGESTKCFAELERVTLALIDEHIERGDIVIALGGGVAGDLAGFAAAILRRGVRFVQIPTSLLAQVDSSIGGKTGIDTRQGKNLVGAFHQPSLVLADTALLDTLPERQFRAGYAEVAKYGLLGDAGFFGWLENNAAAIFAGDALARATAIETSCLAKARIVAEDELESGVRALLNLGHTFGHALEAATGYGERLLHGEAISIGMALAFEFSVMHGDCPAADSERAIAHFADVGLPVSLSQVPGELPGAEGLLDLMTQDKKMERGKMTLILAHAIGDAYVARNVDMPTLAAFLKRKRN